MMRLVKIGKENTNMLVCKTLAFTGMFIQEGMVRNVFIKINLLNFNILPLAIVISISITNYYQGQ